MSTLVSRKVTYEQSAADLYETPPEITKMILDKLELNTEMLIYEPAYGRGAISKMLKERGFKVREGDIQEGEDFLCTRGLQNYDLIITNPPYKYALEFILKSLEHLKKGGQAIFLLRLSFLESVKRSKFFRTGCLKKVYVSSKRITMFPANGEKPKASGTVAYGWFIFEKDYKGKTELDWFNF